MEKEIGREGPWQKIKRTFLNTVKEIDPTQKEGPRDDQEHVMSPDEEIDEAGDESFPASDPPGHRSKSTEDKNLH